MQLIPQTDLTFWSFAPIGKQTVQNVPEAINAIAIPWFDSVHQMEAKCIFQWALNFYAIIGKQKAEIFSWKKKSLNYTPIERLTFLVMSFCDGSFCV